MTDKNAIQVRMRQRDELPSLLVRHDCLPKTAKHIDIKQFINDIRKI